MHPRSSNKAYSIAIHLGEALHEVNSGSACRFWIHANGEIKSSPATQGKEYPQRDIWNDQWVWRVDIN